MCAPRNGSHIRCDTYGIEKKITLPLEIRIIHLAERKMEEGAVLSSHFAMISLSKLGLGNIRCSSYLIEETL